MKQNYPISEFFNRIPLFPHSVLNESGNRVAFTSSLSGSPQVWTAEIPSEGLLRYPKPLTSDQKKRTYVFDSALQWIGDHRLACVFDIDGDEETFIEIFDLKTGDVTPVPRGEKGARDFLSFVDKEVLFFTSNRGHLLTQGLFTYSLSSGKVTEILYDKEFSVAWTGVKYKKEQLYAMTLENTSNRIFAVDLKTKKSNPIFVTPQTLTIPVAELKNGNILVTSDRDREFSSPAELNPKTGTLKFLGPDEWDREIRLSRDKKFLMESANVAGKTVLTLKKWPSMKKVSLRFSEKGVVTHFSFSKKGNHVLLGYASPTEPADIYRVDLKTKKAQRLTDNYVSKIPQKQLVDPKLIRFASQGRQVYSWLFLPKNAKKNSKLPVIVWPHGGPQFQEKAQPRPIFQYFLSRGFAIWAPNHSGSTGFGKTFTRTIEKSWGDADLPDMENGMQWLKKSGWIDSEKMVIMGGSYGGYMTLRSITKLPEVFKAAVDIFGVSNLLSFSSSVPEDWNAYMGSMVGDPIKDREMLIGQSPFFALDKIRCPLLVIQGAKDPRVVKAESDQVVAALQARNHPVEYLVFEDEGHGFFKLENELIAYSRAAEFIEKYIS